MRAQDVCAGRHAPAPAAAEHDGVVAHTAPGVLPVLAQHNPRRRRHYRGVPFVLPVIVLSRCSLTL